VTNITVICVWLSLLAVLLAVLLGLAVDVAQERFTRHSEVSHYLNSNKQIVSWSLEEVIDVNDTNDTDIDHAGTAVYSKLGQRRMRPEYFWRLKSFHEKAG